MVNIWMFEADHLNANANTYGVSTYHNKKQLSKQKNDIYLNVFLCSSLRKQRRSHTKIDGIENRIAFLTKKSPLNDNKNTNALCKNPSLLPLCDDHTILEMEISLVYASIYYNTRTKSTLVLLYYCCIEETGTGLSYRADGGGPGLIRYAMPSSSAGRNALLVAAEAASELHNKTPFHKAPREPGDEKTVLGNLKVADMRRSRDTARRGALWYKIMPRNGNRGPQSASHLRDNTLDFSGSVFFSLLTHTTSDYSRHIHNFNFLPNKSLELNDKMCYLSLPCRAIHKSIFWSS